MRNTITEKKSGNNNISPLKYSGSFIIAYIWLLKKKTIILKQLLSIFTLIIITVFNSGCDSRPEPAHASNKSKDDTIEQAYTIEKDDSNGYTSQVLVYVSDTSKLNDINATLVEKFQDKFSSAITIWYFDKKGFAETYINSLHDDKVSDKKFNEMDKHLIATYEELKGKKGELVRNN